MATTFQFCEYTGAAAYDSPGYHGGVLTNPIQTCNWKSIDAPDSGTGQSANYKTNPITAGTNSLERYVYGRFAGTYNKLQNGLFGHTAGDFGGGVNILLKTILGPRMIYRTPSQTDLATKDSPAPLITVDITAPTAITGGQTVYFSATAPYDPTATYNVVAGSGDPSAFTSFLVTQLQTTTSATAGDTTQVTMTLRYDEN